MDSNKLPFSCSIITEGIAGTENQCIGVAEALGIPYKTMRIGLREPWKTLSPYIGFEESCSFTPSLPSPPWPNLLITSGRKSIAASRYIKKTSKGKTFTVHIQDPRISSKNFDLVAVPAHDPMRGDNVIVTQASPNKITPALLKQARDHFQEFGDLPSPRVAVLIGGSSKAYTLTPKITNDLVQTLLRIKASLMITCSRRTGEDNQKILENGLRNDTNYFWDGIGSNPYLGYLAWADYIMVTADSASMISESCTTGKPVYMIDLEGGAKRISKLHDNLINHGSLRKFNGEFEPYTYDPLNDAQMIAKEIKKRIEVFTKERE